MWPVSLVIQDGDKGSNSGPTAPQVTNSGLDDYSHDNTYIIFVGLEQKFGRLPGLPCACPNDYVYTIK